jgi:hypothetical protein
MHERRLDLAGALAYMDNEGLGIWGLHWWRLSGCFISTYSRGCSEGSAVNINGESINLNLSSTLQFP